MHWRGGGDHERSCDTVLKFAGVGDFIKVAEIEKRSAHAEVRTVSWPGVDDHAQPFEMFVSRLFEENERLYPANLPVDLDIDRDLQKLLAD